MSELFGVSMDGIMTVLLGLFGVSVLGIAAIYFSNRTMFRMGLRNIPRRGGQTALVVLGLMLSTLIITASFATGDTIDHSVTKTTYDILGRTDLRLDVGESNGDGVRGYVQEGLVPTLEQRFAGDADIQAFLPLLIEPVPVVNGRTRLSEPNVHLTGVDLERIGAFGGLRLRDGGKADVSTLGPREALVSKTMAKKLDIVPGDTLTVYVQNQEWTLTVAGIAADTLASGAQFMGNSGDAGGFAVALTTAQEISGHAGKVNWVSVALTGDERSSVARSDAAEARLESYFSSDEGRDAAGLGDFTVKVDPVKQDAIDTAKTMSTMFTTVFLVLGLFSIAAGVLLIFMIFVMLAAERKTEMGMARAVGAKRRNLVQMFVSEGMAYSVVAGALGAALGVGAAFALVVVGLKAVLGDEASFVSAYVTPRTLVVSYCLGVVLTFITVLVSSFRVSHLNIVAAVRGVDEEKGREARRTTRWLWVALGIPALVVPPLGLHWLLRKGFGLPSVWVWSPLGLVAGVLLMLMGSSSDKLFPFALGISLLPLSLAGLARTYGAPARLTWSAVGALLLAYWLMPANLHEALFGTLDGNIEMFVLSGIMIVIGSTLLIVFNARVLTNIFRGGHGFAAYAPAVALGAGVVAAIAGAVALGDTGDGLGQLLYLLAALLGGAGVLAVAAARIPRLAPALKMGVAYPIANRFRTGMTVAMFSLIVFSIVCMSTLNANFLSIFSSDEARGGWDVVAESNASNRVDDLQAALREEGSFDTAQIRDTARATAAMGTHEVRQAGEDEWESYPVRAGDAAFYSLAEMKLGMRATGYDSDRAVFDAVATSANLAIIDAVPVPDGDFGDDTWKVKGLKSGDETFAPFEVEIRDPLTGKQATLTVVGVLTSKLSWDLMPGVWTNEATYARVYGTPDYRVSYLRLQDGVDSEAAAKGIKAALLTKGVQAFSVEQRVEDDNAESMGFMRIFQLFMGLGLFVGIAALGVIAFRSVMERRQQIGMLRAIGYQRGTVALTFLLESSFIALMGILSGVAGAAVLSRNLMTSDEFTGTSTTGFHFFIPWSEVIVFVVVAYGFSLLLTWWPSRGASRVPVAEALRYE